MPEEKRTELGSLGEFELINRLVEGFETVNESTVKSIGDDAAVVELPRFGKTGHFRFSKVARILI